MSWQCPNCGWNNSDSTTICTCSYIANESDTLKTREVALEFRASTKEYFRVWIVNLCLTLLTLGIFSAWAKVRKKRYFYSHLVLDGTPFQYLGQPIPILKGRLIAAAMFITYYASNHFFTSLLPYVLVAGIVLAPWVIVRSAAFNARYSAFRNMTFLFEGKYLDAVKALFLWALIPIVAGMIFGGRSGFRYVAFFFPVLLLFFPWWYRRLKNFIVTRTLYGGKNGAFSARGSQFYAIYIKAGLISIGLFIIAAIPIGILGYLKGKYSPSGVMVYIFALPIYLSYLLGFSYVKANMGNLIWSNTRLGPLRFHSSMLGRELAKIYITNAIGIVLSLGLLTPWAVIRTFKYRAEKMKILLEGDWMEFQGSPETSTVRAAGSEIGDFFEVDLSI